MKSLGGIKNHPSLKEVWLNRRQLWKILFLVEIKSVVLSWSPWLKTMGHYKLNDMQGILILVKLVSFPKETPKTGSCKWWVRPSYCPYRVCHGNLCFMLRLLPGDGIETLSPCPKDLVQVWGTNKIIYCAATSTNIAIPFLEACLQNSVIAPHNWQNQTTVKGTGTSQTQKLNTLWPL